MTGAPVLGRAEGPSREDTRGRRLPPLPRFPVTNDATSLPARGIDSVAEVRTREHRAHAELAQRRHGRRTGLQRRGGEAAAREQAAAVRVVGFAEILGAGPRRLVLGRYPL